MKSDSTLAYLRRMNPLPQPAPVDGADLYDRITALPPDEQLTTRRPGTAGGSPWRQSLSPMALLATTAFALSGWFGDVVKPAVTKQEYKAAQGELTLPPGTTWPWLHVDPNSVTGRGAGGGHAVLIAMGSWECYWAARSGAATGRAAAGGAS